METILYDIIPSDNVTNVLKIRGSQSPFLLMRPWWRPNRMTSSIKMVAVERSFVPVEFRIDFNTCDLISLGKCLEKWRERVWFRNLFLSLL